MASTNSWCIVALPEETHPVHKVSSEKSAHMTILFLGEQREPALAVRIIEALQHTIATSLKHKFSLGVQKRGTLGQDQADVLFFYKDEAGRIKDFRSLLLKNDDIKKAYDSTTQFPEWTPHLTLGYPDTPAHPMPDDNHSISWITFDRIALWLEDSDGPEIELDVYGSGLATPDEAFHFDQMVRKGLESVTTSDDFLAHYGVKGMKWGQRKRAALQDRADSLNRVAKGKSTTTDKIVATNTLSALDIVRGRGVKGGAAIKAKQYEKAVAKLDAKAARKSEKAAKGKAAANKSSQKNGKRRIDTISDKEAIAEVEAWLKEQGM